MVFDDVKVGDRFMVRHGLESAFTVFEITKRGFKYKMDKPYQAYPARFGSFLVTEGEIYCKDPELDYVAWDSIYTKVE